MTEIKYINARFDDNKYYRLSDGYVYTNADEEDIKSLEKRFNTILPRKSIRITPKKKEVWLLWQSEPWYDPELLGIYSTEEIAEKHKKEKEDYQREYQLNQWREYHNKGPTELPDEDLKPNYDYFIDSWTVRTE